MAALFYFYTKTFGLLVKSVDFSNLCFIICERWKQWSDKKKNCQWSFWNLVDL